MPSSCKKGERFSKKWGCKVPCTKPEKRHSRKGSCYSPSKRKGRPCKYSRKGDKCLSKEEFHSKMKSTESRVSEALQKGKVSRKLLEYAKKERASAEKDERRTSKRENKGKPRARLIVVKD